MENSGDSKKEKIEAFFVSEFGKGIASEVWLIKRGTAPWDSLKHIELINSFEKLFSLQLNFDEACSISKAEDFMRLLEKH